MASLASLDSWCFLERFYATKARSASTLFFFFKVTVGFSFAVISNTFSTHHHAQKMGTRQRGFDSFAELLQLAEHLLHMVGSLFQLLRRLGLARLAEVLEAAHHLFLHVLHVEALKELGNGFHARIPGLH